ncbi:MAG: hypothetical protein WCI40_07200 [Verrucomicrobiota bacterium]
MTSTIVAWLPVFTTSARCDILVQSLAYCRMHKGLVIYGWVILDNHFHAILAAPDLPRVLADLKRHTAQQLGNESHESNGSRKGTQSTQRKTKHPLLFASFAFFAREILLFCAYSTVTLLARLRGLSTSQPSLTARW